jgi:hypothetical protein
VRGQLPIVIAMIIVGAIMISSLYFVSRLNIESYTKTPIYKTLKWLWLDNELDTLNYIALSIGSKTAYTVFEKTYNETSDLNLAEEKANEAMSNVVSWIINNWTKLKIQEGYGIEFLKVKSVYNISYGYGYSSVAFQVLITNRYGEYRVYTKNITLKLYASLYTTEIGTVNLPPGLIKNLNGTLIISYIFNITAFINHNNIYEYYALSPVSFEMIKTKFYKNVLSKTISSYNFVNYTIDAEYYTGKGENILVTSLKINLTKAEEQNKLRDIMHALIDLHKNLKQGTNFIITIQINNIYASAITSIY